MSDPKPKRIYLSVPRTVGHGRDIVRGIYARQPPGNEWELHLGDLTGSLDPAVWDGCIFMGTQHIDPGVPTVHCSNGHEPQGMDSVHEDNVLAGRMAANYFLGQGYESFLHVGIPNPLYARERAQGFQEVLGDRAERFMIWGDHWHDAKGNRALTDLLRAMPKPVALFAASDGAGLHVLRALRPSELLLPEEVAVMGVDNDDLICELPRPSLSSIRLAGETIGRQAARLLQARLEDPARPPERIRIPPLEVVERESCGDPALRHPEVRRAMACIRRRASEPIGVPDIVESTGLKRRALEQHFLRETGRSIHETLQDRRLEQARTLMQNPERSLQEIADRCGFQSPSRFSVVFRQIEGCSPREYRTTLASA